MDSKFLIAHKFKPIGWFVFILGAVLGIILMLHEFKYPNWEFNVFPLIGDKDVFSMPPLEWGKNNIADEIASILIIVGGLIVSFSKTKDEDEYINKIRMESLLWATYVNYGILILAMLFVFDLSFFNVMIYNMFTILLFFMLRFHFKLYQSKKTIAHEE